MYVCVCACCVCVRVCVCGGGGGRGARAGIKSSKERMQRWEAGLCWGQPATQAAERIRASAACTDQHLRAGRGLAQGRTAASLQSENEELAARADRLLERQALLEQCAESLKAENRWVLHRPPPHRPPHCPLPPAPALRRLPGSAAG